MEPIRIVDDIYWVGGIDWNIRDFHGYSTYRGSTYNAYLVMDEKVALIDTVKAGFEEEMFARIRQIVDPKKIDLVVSNHTEMDHSGGLPRVMHYIGEDKPVYCSAMGGKNLPDHYGGKLNYQVVENRGQLGLGKRSLTFLETRMLHWPDSMFSYCPEEKMLFSSDAFGQHFAGLQRFDDQVGDEIMPHAKKYYANILMPYSPLILKLVDLVKELNLDIQYILPDHGIMWRKDPLKIIQAYVNWAEQKPARKAVVVYDTMWKSTAMMARAIVDELGVQNVAAELCDLRSWHRSDVITEVQDAGAILVGSPTLNNNIFPTVADFLVYMKGLRPQNKVAGAFGSYGWSGEATRILQKELESMKFDLVSDPVLLKYVPDEDGLEKCRQLARAAADALPGA
jgi:flavorubredoxin